MHKLTCAVLILIFTSSCSQESKDEKYFKNCVEDSIKVNNVTEQKAVQFCQIRKKNYPDEFNYYKGKIYSETK